MTKLTLLGLLLAACVDIDRVDDLDRPLPDPTADSFAPTGSLITARLHHSAILLRTGQILVTGGVGATGGVLSSAELYTPWSGTFSPTGAMLTARAQHMSALLPDGTVLVAGGVNAAGNPIMKAEIYDPITGTFAATGALHYGHYTSSAFSLANGTVVVLGGNNRHAEIYNPATRTFTVGALSAELHEDGAAAQLADGRVLVTGGCTATVCPTTTAELYDPVANTWSRTAPMSEARNGHTATLAHGANKVLIVGGEKGACIYSCGSYPPTAELFDPATGSFSAPTPILGRSIVVNGGSDIFPIIEHTTTALSDGRFAVIGGEAPSLHAYIFPNSTTITVTGTSIAPVELPAEIRSEHTSTALPNCQVVNIGGYGGPLPSTVLGTASLFDYPSACMAPSDPQQPAS